MSHDVEPRRQGPTTISDMHMAGPASLDVSSFAATQLALLEQELQAELSETSSLISDTTPTALQRTGVAITNLTLASQRTGLGGKTVVELVLDPAVGGRKDGELPEHDIRVGDIVSISQQPAGSAKKREVKELEAKGAKGVVTKVNKSGIYVALDKEEEDVAIHRLWLVKLANDMTYKR